MSYVCERCREELAGPDVSVCPHCHYDPGDELSTSAWRNRLTAGLLCLVIVGIPVAPIFFWRGRKRAKRAKTATPAIEV